MVFERIIEGKDHLWAVRDMSKPANELALLFSNWNRRGHASWLRIYAIRLEKDVFVVTGGAIKLTRTMQERPHTQEQLDKLNRCRQYLKNNGVFDADSFVSLTLEDEI